MTSDLKDYIKGLALVVGAFTGFKLLMLVLVG